VKLIGLHLKPEYLAFSFVLVAAAFLYFPGLSGPLLFDDYNSLKPLGNWGVIDSVEKLSLFFILGPYGSYRPASHFIHLFSEQQYVAS
jgi:hypothetical protein